ncbi:hypothetical protein HG536_0E01790 [Torulaspora globosa]|uniref:Uncharacterized protein n=1 Tax=Torulaspora globosa TaxID=48254 RepID=A0A7G3ZID2_9SACH|nr:uncharacterized protein HG536_0E01790 [Torulaspora globosa]QLL33268.1 hypothetical protein HG536_0E01790 [Torulaspora globosa]
MSSQWNTRHFSKKLGGSLCKVLREISSEDQILVLQPEMVSVIGEFVTFSQLTSSTPVRKIVVLSDQTITDLSNILASTIAMQLVFLIDVRADLAIPAALPDILGKLNLESVNLIYCTWETQKANSLLNRGSDDDFKIPHFIQHQLPKGIDVRLHPLAMLAFPQIDDNLLVGNFLFNSDGGNMYSPNTCSMQSATRAILLDNMANCLHTLMKETKSIITDAIAFGEESEKLLHLLRGRIEAGEDDEEAFIKDTLYGDKYSGIEKDLVVIERDMDPLTPLLTQLTYSGLLDEIYGLSTDGKVNGLEDVALKYRTDEIWDDLKFMNFGALGPQLNQMAKDLQDKYDARHKAESVGEIKEFVESLSSLQAKQKLLKVHTTLSSNVLQEVENNASIQFNRILELEQNILLGNLDHKSSCDSLLELIYEGEVSLKRILRLICLSSICKYGLRDKDYDLLKRELIDTYGIETCFQLEKLTVSGLFSSKGLLANHSNSAWRKEYRYISTWLDTLPPVEDEGTEVPSRKGGHDAANPRDATFAYCGVIPLVVRFVQLLYDRSVVSKNYASQQPYIISRRPSLAKIGGLFEQIYGRANVVHEESWLPDLKKNKKRVTIGQKDSKTNDITIIAFLGGVTLGEIATLRFLQNSLQAKNINKRFIFVCDGIINGSRYIP